VLFPTPKERVLELVAPTQFTAALDEPAVAGDPTSSQKSEQLPSCLPGSQFPDEWVVRGNHHDAWVNGAEDPVSGMSAELEEARALGELRKQGWSPKRTIVYG
jgi:hypothetical protein